MNGPVIFPPILTAILAMMLTGSAVVAAVAFFAVVGVEAFLIGAGFRRR